MLLICQAMQGGCYLDDTGPCLQSSCMKLHSAKRPKFHVRSNLPQQRQAAWLASDFCFISPDSLFFAIHLSYFSLELWAYIPEPWPLVPGPCLQSSGFCPDKSGLDSGPCFISSCFCLLCLQLLTHDPWPLTSYPYIYFFLDFQGLYYLILLHPLLITNNLYLEMKWNKQTSFLIKRDEVLFL